MKTNFNLIVKFLSIAFCLTLLIVIGSNEPVLGYGEARNFQPIYPQPSVPMTGSTAQPDPGLEAEYMPGEMILKIRQPLQGNPANARTGISAIDALNLEFGVTSMEVLVSDPSIKALSNLSGIYLLHTGPQTDIPSAVEAYARLNEVEYAQPNYIYRLEDEICRDKTDLVPDDPRYAEQWYLPQMHAAEGWEVTQGTSTVVVAVVDTGVNYNHPDLSLYDAITAPDGKVILGYDFVNGDSDPVDDNGHGTAMAGLIAAKSNNGTGISGVCWNCKILAIKSMAANGTGTTWNVTQGIQYAVSHNASVINLSLGGPGEPAMVNAINAAYESNIVVVASAGNDNSYTPQYPAASDHVFSVAATNQTDGRLFNSNYGYWVDVAAPGYGLLSTSIDGAYNNTCCTSGATALTSGTAGLVKSVHPTWTSDQVMSQIACTAEDIRSLNPGFEDFLGTGRVDIYNALAGVPAATCGIRGTGYQIQVGEDESAIYPGNTFSLVLKAKTDAAANQEVSATLSSTYPNVTFEPAILSYGNLNFGVITANITPLSISIDADAMPGDIIPIDVVFQDKSGSTYPASYSITVHPQRLSGWPQVMSWGSGGSGSPILRDIDHNSASEILHPNLDGILYIWNPDGSDLPGWPKPGLGTLPISVADINRDGVEEIVRPGSVYDLSGSLLPGWPQSIISPNCPALLASPVIGDINGDGYLEIVIGNYLHQVFVFSYTGILLDGWPQMVNGAISATPALADLNGDGYLEIVVATWPLGGTCGEDEGTGGVSVLGHDGTLLPGWPKTAPSTDSSPAIADLDKDGQLEIAVANYAYEANGALLPGFPVAGFNGTPSSSPAIADLDNDGNLDILLGDTKGMKVYAIQGSTGAILPGWPQSTAYRVFGSPAVVDLDGDSDLEVVVVATDEIRAWHAGGQPVAGFPIRLGGSNWSAPAAGDVNGDGRLELFVIGGGAAKVYAWDMGAGSYTPSAMPWPQFHHDPWHTGLYGFAAIPSPGAIAINNFALRTNARDVTLSLSAPGFSEMMLSNDPAFSGAAWEPFSASRAWQLPEADGPWTVYARFRDEAKAVTPTVHARIILDHTPPSVILASPAASETVLAIRALPVTGTVDASDLDHYTVQYGLGDTPTAWEQIGTPHSASVLNDTLEMWLLDSIHTGTYTLKVEAQDIAGNIATQTHTISLVRPIHVPDSLSPTEIQAGSTAALNLQLSNPFADKTLVLDPGTQVWLVDDQPAHDQLAPPFNYSGPENAIGLDGGSQAAQTFIAPRTFLLQKISWQSAQVYPGIGSATLELRLLDATGMPSDTVLYTKTVAFNGPDWWCPRLEADNVNYWLQEGQGYALVLTTTSRNHVAFHYSITLPGGADYFNFGVGSPWYEMIPGAEFTVRLYERPAYAAELSAGVTLSGDETKWLAFTGTEVPHTLAAGVYQPYLTYTGTLNGTPFLALDKLVASITVVSTAPVITEGLSVGVTMDEDGAPAPFALSLHATSPDPAAALSWSLGVPPIHGTADASGSGETLALGYTPYANYNGSDRFTVVVSDENGFSDAILVNVLVNSINDPPYEIQVSPDLINENMPPGSVVGNLATSDVDSPPPFTYTFVSGVGGTDNTSFSINGSQLITNAAFDYETQVVYLVRLRTMDNQGGSYEDWFPILVNNVNEAPTSLTLSKNTVAEHVPAGTVVGTFSGSDPDAGNTLTYSLSNGIGGEDNPSFSLVGNTLYTAEVFDYTAQNSYSIRVRVMDNGFLFLDKVFEIQVHDSIYLPVITR
jgi:thermitase